jgi:hypothetical protein
MYKMIAFFFLHKLQATKKMRSVAFVLLQALTKKNVRLTAYRPLLVVEIAAGELTLAGWC